MLQSLSETEPAHCAERTDTSHHSPSRHTQGFESDISLTSSSASSPPQSALLALVPFAESEASFMGL